MIGRNDNCWCHSGKKWKKCHFPAEDASSPKVKNQQLLKDEYLKRYDILLKDEKQIQGIREACRLASFILDETCKLARPGISTQELNDFAHRLHLEYNALPAPLNYGEPPFPKSICTSINDVICHGIPNAIPLQEGDILNVDVTSILHGYYGDCSKMVVIGDPTAERKLVVDTAYECLMQAIAIYKPNIEVREIGQVIERHALSKNCSVVYQFVGHGVGIHFHENPQIPHCYNGIKTPLVPGMIFTIEPMINAGVKEAVVDPDDQWTARTADGKASAQFEHTILITDQGHEILTNWKI